MTDKNKTNTEQTDSFAWSELHDLILGEEKKELSKIKHTLEDDKTFSDKLAELFPDTIEKAKLFSEEYQRKLVVALRNTIKEANGLNRSMRHEKRSLNEKINIFLHKHISFRALKWKFEAAKQKIDYELLFNEKTSTYFPAYALVFFNETHELIQEAKWKGLEELSGDEKENLLNNLCRSDCSVFKDFSIAFEKGQVLSLLVLYKGTLDKEIEQRHKTAVLGMHSDFYEILQKKEDRIENFAEKTAYIDWCLFEKPDKKYLKSPFVKYLLVFLLGVLLAFWGVSSYLHHKKVANLLSEIQNQESVYFAYATAENGKNYIRGLSASDFFVADEVFKKHGLDKSSVVVKIKALNKCPKAAPELYEEEIDAQVSEIERLHFFFDRNNAEIQEKQANRLDKLEEAIKKLTRYAEQQEKKLHIRVHGYADSTGYVMVNKGISLARAENVIALLMRRGIPEDIFQVVGHGYLRRDDADTIRQSHLRKVTFEVDFEKL